MIVVRYADDMVAGFQLECDARRFLADLAHRLERFGLQLNADKTRIIEFGRYAARIAEPVGSSRKPSNSWGSPISAGPTGREGSSSGGTRSASGSGPGSTRSRMQCYGCGTCRSRIKEPT